MGRGFAISGYVWKGCHCTYFVERERHGSPWSARCEWRYEGSRFWRRVTGADYANPTSAQSACYRHDRECEAVQAALTFAVRWIREGEMLARDRKGGV